MISKFGMTMNSMGVVTGYKSTGIASIQYGLIQL